MLTYFTYARTYAVSNVLASTGRRGSTRRLSTRAPTERSPASLSTSKRSSRHRRLQPAATEAATRCRRRCNPVWQRLQPRAAEAVALPRRSDPNPHEVLTSRLFLRGTTRVPPAALLLFGASPAEIDVGRVKQCGRVDLRSGARARLYFVSYVSYVSYVSSTHLTSPALPHLTSPHLRHRTSPSYRRCSSHPRPHCSTR